MSEESEKQEGQKTVVAFIAGLLIGGLLVWVFSSPQDTTAPDSAGDDTTASEIEDTDAGDNDTTTEGSNDSNATAESQPEVPALPVGDGELNVTNQSAGAEVILTSAEFPTADGWVAIRDYDGTNVGGILGAARYSESQGLIPESVPLLRETVPGVTYAAVFFTEDGAVDADGDLTFDPAGDQQIDGILETFTAQ